MSELDRIRADIARAKQRIGELQRGERGVRSGPWQEVEGMPGAGLAYSNQLRAQESALAKLELEYVMAMVPRPWEPAEVIRRMEGK